MQWTASITLGALGVYCWMIVNVGIARGKYKVPAPQTNGPVEFLQILRIQINTAEQLCLFLPALWMCAYFLDDRWAALGGVMWIIGRIMYALAYSRAPQKRAPGFGITILASVGLMVGTAVGLIMH